MCLFQNSFTTTRSVPVLQISVMDGEVLRSVKGNTVAMSDASLAAPALGIYVASIHIFMFDDGCSATIAATRVGAQERI